MRPKSLLLLTLALGCGLVASLGISQVLDRSGRGAQVVPETDAIYIAKTDINLGDKITEEFINLEAWPKDKVPPGAVRSLEDVLDRHPRTKIYQGEPILDVKLVSADSRDNPAEQVPDGYRVVSVRVDAHTGGAGLLRPGDRVDVQLFVKKNKETGIGVTKAKTILREVRVFAVDQAFRRRTDEEEASPARTVSLVVTPEQADKLTLATKLGEINLTIRNPDDRRAEPSDGASIDDLFVSSRVDRDTERGAGAEQPKSGFLDFMQQLGRAASAAKTAPTHVVATAPWTMLIMEGSDVREVELEQQGDSAVWTSGGGAAQGPGGSGPGPWMAAPGMKPAAATAPAADTTVPDGGGAADADPDNTPNLGDELMDNNLRVPTATGATSDSD